MDVKRQVLLELQWQGRSGRFHHVVVSSGGLRQVLGTFTFVALVALALLVAFPLRSNRALAHSNVDTILRENVELKAQQDALRKRAFDLAEQLYERVEQGRRMLRSAGITGHASDGQCVRPPARDAGDDALLAWLSEQGTRLEAIGNELAPARAGMGVLRASAQRTGDAAAGPGTPVRPAECTGSAWEGSSALPAVYALGSGPPAARLSLPPPGSEAAPSPRVWRASGAASTFERGDH